MPEDRHPVRIAVNVMRARLTVVGFNLTIVALQLGQLKLLPGGIELPNVDFAIHLESAVSLLMAMALSVLAIVAFIGSGAFDRDGTCTHPSLLAGDLLMYLGLAHSVAGFFAPFIQTLDHAAAASAPQMAELSTVRAALVILGGVAWLCAIYVGPAVSLIRSPFGRRVSVALGVAYVVLMLALAYASAKAVRLEMARDPALEKPAPTLLNELVQPLRW